MQQSESVNTILGLNAQLSRVNKRLDSAFFVHGISLTEFLILLNLSQADDQSLRRVELAETVGLTASGVTRVVAPMEKIGLVNKRSNERDARVSLVELTKSGQSLLNDAMVTIEQSSDSILQNLSKPQRRDLLNLLGKLSY